MEKKKYVVFGESKVHKPTTETFESAIRSICEVQQLRDSEPHVYCNPNKREIILKRYGEMPERARMIMEQVRQEAIERQNSM